MPAAVVVPIKPLGLAKSRLRPAFPRTTDDLVLAMALDVLAAAVECPAVARVVAITDDPRMSSAAEELGVTVWPDEPRSGLNDALLHAAGRLPPDLTQIWQPGDCPCTTAEDLDALLEAAAAEGRPVFVSDAEGTGTTSLAVPSGLRFTPRYGHGSAGSHRAAGARELRGERWRRMSRDVDTAEDLARALTIGTGNRTSAWAEANR